MKHTLEREQWLPIPTEQAWDFFSSPRNLAKITPGDMGFRIREPFEDTAMFTGQRTRARVIGDAIANAKTLQMGLESRKADSGTYGVAGTTYGWKADGSDATGPALIPTFQPSGNSKMNYSVTVDGGGLTYILTVTDPSIGSGVTAYQTNQLGQELAKYQQ